MAEPNEIWVIDTSSILQIRRAVSADEREKVYDHLTDMVKAGSLVFPVQVFDELHRFKNLTKPDPPYEWAKLNKAAASKYDPLYEHVKNVLADSQLKNVLDPQKDHEEADPYVLALAMKISEQTAVGVLTQDRVSQPTKLSLNDGCGLVRIVTLTMEPFLIQQAIWTP